MKEAESIDKFILVKTAKFDEFVQTQKTLAQSPIREVLTAAATISHEFGRVDTTEESKTLLFKDTLYDLTRHLAEYLITSDSASIDTQLTENGCYLISRRCSTIRHFC